MQVVSDQSRWSYAAWGLGQTRITHFLGRRSLGAVTRLARQGIRNTHPTGTRWQSAGTFAIDRERSFAGVICPSTPAICRISTRRGVAVA